jgi:hypothetical protein
MRYQQLGRTAAAMAVLLVQPRLLLGFLPGPPASITGRHLPVRQTRSLEALFVSIDGPDRVELCTREFSAPLFMNRREAVGATLALLLPFGSEPAHASGGATAGRYTYVENCVTSSTKGTDELTILMVPCSREMSVRFPLPNAATTVASSKLCTNSYSL